MLAKPPLAKILVAEGVPATPRVYPSGTRPGDCRRRGVAAGVLPALYLLAAGLAWLGFTPTAQAFPLVDALTPSILAPTPGALGGALGEPNDLTAQIGPPGPFAGAPALGWNFTPRIGAQTSLNSNVLATHANPKWDWVNYLSPGLSVAANTDRITARFDYSPTLAIYARTPQLNYLSQNFTGNGSITFVPDLFYMDLRGLAGVQPRAGTGFGAAGVGTTGAAGAAGTPGTAGLPPNQLNQVATVGVTPYLLHRFSEYGTGKIGYSFNLTNQKPVTGFGSLPFIGSSSSSSTAANTLTPAQQQQLNQSGLVVPGQLNQTSTQITNQEVAQFQSGEFLGRFNNLTVASASQYSGSGTQSGYQNTLNNQLGYALTRQTTVFASIGYENISYSGTPPTRINDATWELGVTLTPNADSTITLGYGHQNGVDSVVVNGGYQVTPRFRVDVSYNTGIGNGLTQLQNNVAASDVNQYGYQVNALTGAPLFNASGVGGGTANLYRTKTFTASATLNLDRDVFAVSGYLSEQQLLATGPVGGGGGAGIAANTSSTTGQATWTHALSSSWSSILSGSYTTQPSQSAVVPGNQTTLSANLTLQYQIDPTLTASAQYAYYDRNSPFTFLSFTQSVFLLGLTKTF